MYLGNSVNQLNFDPISIKLSLNFNSILIKLSPNFNSIFKELSLNWYKIVSQILQNCHSSCIALLLIPLLWVSVDVIMVYRTIHLPDGGRLSNTTATWVWPLKGVWSTNTTEHRRACSTITCGAFTHSFIQWLSRDSWAFRLLQLIRMVVISPCVINHANYSVVQNQSSGVLSSVWVGPADCSRYDVRWLISGRLSCWDSVLAKLGQLPKCCL